MRKAHVAVVFMALLLVTLSAFTVANADYTPAQARQSWTFSASQLNDGTISFYFKSVSGGDYDLKINFNDAVFNSTNYGYADLYYNNGSYGDTFARLAWGGSDATFPYHWTEDSVQLFGGSTYNSTQNPISDVTPEFVYKWRGMERQFNYWNENENTTTTVTTFPIMQEVANFSHCNINMKWALTSGSMTLTLVPAVNTTNIVEILMIGAVLTVVMGSLGAVAKKKYA